MAAEPTTAASAPSAISPDDAPTRSIVWRRLAIALVVVGLAIRLWIAANTLGTNDVGTWHRFGRIINENGLAASYVADHELNHPPIAALWAAGAYRIAGGRLDPFALLIRLPAIVFDVLTCALLWHLGVRHGGARLAVQLVAAAALNPVLILVSGYHGNTDNAYAALSLLAFVLMGERRPLLAGLALGAAMNVKIIPMLLLPALLASCRQWKDALRVALGYAAPLVLFIVPTVATQGVFFNRLFKYGSNAENWGTLLLLRLMGDSGFDAALMKRVETFYYAIAGKWVMAALILLVAAWSMRARVSPVVAGALGACMYLGFAPGFGVQYLALPAVFLLAADLRFGVYFAMSGGLFLACCYYMFLGRGTVMQSIFTTELFSPSCNVGLIAWGLLLTFTVLVVTRRMRPSQS